MSALIYWLGIRLYAIVVRIASLFNAKAGLFIKGREGLLANIKYTLLDEKRPRIWMHCASLGEFEQGRPILEKLKSKYPQYAIVLTFFSPSGYEVRKNYKGADYIFYLPLDSVYNAKRFVRYVNPSLCIFVKYEYWYYYLSKLVKNNIPTILISAIFRPTQPFFKWYGRLHRRMLNCFTHIFVQDERSQVLIEKLGVQAVTVAGDTRFDRVLEAASVVEKQEIASQFCDGSNIIVAGSTWPEDEELLHKTLSVLPENWKLILVPHEIHAAHIQGIQKLFGAKSILWSEWKHDANASVLVVDKMGLLLSLYRYGKLAWVGGGLGTKGLHNILEPAVYGIPVGFGMNHEKFREAQGLIEAGGALSTNDPIAFANYVLSADRDKYSYEQICKASKSYVISNSGATGRILNYLELKKLLSNP